MYRESVACSRIRLLEQTDAQVQGAARGSSAHADCARIPPRFWVFFWVVLLFFFFCFLKTRTGST